MVKIKANGNEIALLTPDTDYISLTDIANIKTREIQDISYKIG